MHSERAPLGLKIAAFAGLAFLHLPIILIFVYAFTTEDRSYQWPPPGLTLKWFGVTWNRPDVWASLGLSLKVAAVSTVIAIVLGTLCAAAVSRAKSRSTSAAVSASSVQPTGPRRRADRNSPRFTSRCFSISRKPSSPACISSTTRAESGSEIA